MSEFVMLPSGTVINLAMLVMTDGLMDDDEGSPLMGLVFATSEDVLEIRGDDAVALDTYLAARVISLSAANTSASDPAVPMNREQLQAAIYDAIMKLGGGETAAALAVLERAHAALEREGNNG